MEALIEQDIIDSRKQGDRLTDASPSDSVSFFPRSLNLQSTLGSSVWGMTSGMFVRERNCEMIESRWIDLI